MQDHGRAKYTDEEVVRGMNLLLEHIDVTYPVLSGISGMSLSAIRHIAAGETHTWMEKVYPEQYKKLRSLKGSRHRKRSVL